MRDSRVEEVEHISDSDSETGDGLEESHPTLGIFPNHVHQVEQGWIFSRTGVDIFKNRVRYFQEQRLAIFKNTVGFLKQGGVFSRTGVDIFKNRGCIFSRLGHDIFENSGEYCIFSRTGVDIIKKRGRYFQE